MRGKNPSPLRWAAIIAAIGVGFYSADRLMKKRKEKKTSSLKPSKIEPSSYPIDRYSVEIVDGQPQFNILSGVLEKVNGNVALITPAQDVLISLPNELSMEDVQIDPNVEVIAGDINTKDFLFRFKTGKQYPILLATMFVSGFDQPLELRHA